MSGPTLYNFDGDEIFTPERPGIVHMGDLMEYIQEMRNIYDSSVTLYNALKSNLSFIKNSNEFSLNGDGIFDNSTLLNNIPVGGTLYFNEGIYNVTQNCTLSIDILFGKNAMIKIANGVTLTVTGKIFNSNQEIFLDGGGTVTLDKSSNEYNLGWFKSGESTINKRWDFARKGMNSFTKKFVRFPKPYLNQPGTEFINTRSYWLFDGEMKFEDNQNSTTIFLDCEFKAKNDLSNFFIFDHVSKPENIYFYGDLQALVPPTLNVGTGVNIKGMARLTFYGNVVLNGFRTPVKIGGSSQTAPVTDVRFYQLQCSFFYETAVSIYGKTGFSTQDIRIDNLTATAAQLDGLNALEIKGSIRNIRVGNVTYATDVAKNGYIAKDAENVVLIESTNDGSLLKVLIDSVYQANANNAVKVQTSPLLPQSVDKIQFIKVCNVFAKFNGNALNIDNCTGVEIESVYNLSDIVIGSQANYVKINGQRGIRNVTDNGNYTTINNYGKQTRGGGVPPAPSVDWGIGTIIRETSDNKVYLRVAKTNNASDFILLN